MNREMLKECIADAKTIKATAIESAKSALEEVFTPQLTALFAERLNELELEETDSTDDMRNEMYDLEEEGLNLDELLAELSKDEESTTETMKPESLEEDLMLEEMSDEEIEELIVQVIDDMIKSGKLMAGEEMEAEEMEAEDETDEDETDEDETDEDETIDEEFDINELLSELEKMKNDDDLKEAKKKKQEEEDKKKEEKDLEKTINELRNELNEVNLLNAKLLYTNKIFKSKNLTESEKIKVLNTFDKAETVKEVKLVFETLTESFKATTAKKNPIKESLGSASKTISTATPKQPIIESNEAFARMQKLAGLRK